MAANRPVFTENFSENLSAIQTFLSPEGSAAFQRLLARLFDETIPMLCRFPQAGRAFLPHAIQSTKAKALARKLRGKLGTSDDLRELIMDDYLVLYLHHKNQLAFLSIKHHRQLSFDLKRFWQEP